MPNPEVTRPKRLVGQKASTGYASGPVFLDTADDFSTYVTSGEPEKEISILSKAIQVSSEQIQDALAGLEGDAADILEFQLAMLEDDIFPERSVVLILNGDAADKAWKNILDSEIADYQSSDEEYFRARSADLIDIRDRVLAALTGASTASIPPGSIYVANDISPSAFLAHDWRTGGGLVLREGSASSHVAMLARAQGVPAIIGVGDVDIPSGISALIDGEQAVCILNPDEAELEAFEHSKVLFYEVQIQAEKDADKPAKTSDGETVQVLVNIADPVEIDSIDIMHVDGVGLMRTEFLFSGENGLPDEETQYRAYRKVLDWAGEKPVTIRTVDAGGDKPVEGLTKAEDNAFLGVRGIRLSLRREDIFRVQIRALLRAAMGCNLKIMLPMVSVPEELDQAYELFEQEAAQLHKGGIEFAMPKIGIMVEVPAVAITPERFRRAAFFSIGSNDLTQYVMAISRDNSELSTMVNSCDPAVQSLIKNVVGFGLANDIEVSLCGDAASEKDSISVLLNAGLRKLSVAPSRIGIIKREIRGFTKPVERSFDN